MSNRETARLIEPAEFVALTPRDPEPIQLSSSDRNRWPGSDSICYPDLSRKLGYAGLQTYPGMIYTCSFQDMDGLKGYNQEGYEHGIRVQSGGYRFAMATVRYFNRRDASGSLTPEMRGLMNRLCEYSMNDMRISFQNYEAEENWLAELGDTFRELPFVAAQCVYVREMLVAQGVSEYDARLEASGILCSAVALRGLIRLDELEALAPGQTTLLQSNIRITFE